MRNFLLLPMLVLLSLSSIAQTPADFKEGQPLSIEGVEFLYTTGVEEVKMIEGIQYIRK